MSSVYVRNQNFYRIFTKILFLCTGLITQREKKEKVIQWSICVGDLESSEKNELRHFIDILKKYDTNFKGIHSHKNL